MAQHKTMTTQFIDGEPNGLRLCNCVGSLITTVYMPRLFLSRAKQLDLPSRGVYYLLRVDGLDIQRLYVGQTTQGVNRLNDHNQKKKWWDRAILFLSDDSNNFTLDTVSGLEEYAIKRALDVAPGITENTVTPKYKITKFQRPFIESLYEEIRFMMDSFGLQLPKGEPTTPEPVSVQPEPLIVAPPDTEKNSIPVTMTKRGISVQGAYDPTNDTLTVLAGASIDLVASISSKDKATGPKRKELMDSGQLIDNGDGTGALLADAPLPSPTAAAQFAFGGSINGRKYWKVKGAKSIKELFG